MSATSSKRIAIIGAGPIGLEAALYAAALGHDVRIFERVEVGGNVRDWGHVRMFSPWSMNTTPLGRACAKQKTALPADECPTGRDFAERYLAAIAASPELNDRIFLGATVAHVGRNRTLKHDLIGDPKRAEFPFRLMIRHTSGKETIAEADVVLDASGVYSNPGWLGDGGIPALGEIANRHRIRYRIDDVLGAERALYEGKTTLVVGAGHSAATTVVALRVLCEAAPGTRVIWAVRSRAELPFKLLQTDPLPERAAVTRKANLIAEGACPQIQYLAGHTVDSVQFDADKDKFAVILNNGRTALELRVDRVVAQVGYGPDNSIYRQLQVHECYATRGPMKLAAALLGESAADCLASGGKEADTLCNPEPGFFIIGHKSYGTRPNFLLRAGHEQVRDVFRLIHADPALDLYEAKRHEASAATVAGAR